MKNKLFSSRQSYWDIKPLLMVDLEVNGKTKVNWWYLWSSVSQCMLVYSFLSLEVFCIYTMASSFLWFLCMSYKYCVCVRERWRDSVFLETVMVTTGNLEASHPFIYLPSSLPGVITKKIAEILLNLFWEEL